MVRASRPLSRHGLVWRVPLCLSFAAGAIGCKDKGIADEPKATYATSVEEQLDLVADAGTFVVVRDLRPFMDMLRLGHTLMDGPGRTFVSKAGKNAKRELEDLQEGLDDVSKAIAAIDASGIALDKGMVVSGDPDKGGVVMVATDIAGLKRMFETLDDDDANEVDEKCAPLPGHDGWVGCAKEKKSVEAYKPGKQGKARRDELAQQLPNFDLAQANVLGALEEVSFGMTTDPGLFSVAVHPKEKLPDEVKRFAGKGKPKAMRYAGPGDGFVWAKIDVKAAMNEAGGDLPAMARPTVEALDGEAYFGGVSAVGPGGALMIGVHNPIPVRGVLDMALAMRSELPSSIPDFPGSSLSLEVKDAKAGDQSYRIAEIKVDAPQLKKAKDLGVETAAIAFVGPEYATVGLGMTAEHGEKLANTSGEGPSEAVLAALPPVAAADLRAGEVTAMYHAPYDGLQSPAMAEALAEIMKEAPDPDLDPSAIPELMKLLAPLSSMTVWASHVDSMPVVHFAVRIFGDERTEQGKAERAAMTAVNGGKSPKDVYGELAKKYGKSPRAAAYRARAMETSDMGSAMGFAGLGVAAAVAIPAMIGYQTKAMSKAMEEVERAEDTMAAEQEALDALRQQAP